MAYCTLADLIKKIPEASLIMLSNDEDEATEVNQVNIDKAIAAADAEIDSYVAIAGNSVPVIPTPPLLNDLSAKMTIWNLHLRKYFKTDIWSETYKTCQRILLRIAEGKLNINSPVETPTDAMIGSTRVQRFNETLWGTFRGPLV